MKKFIIGMYKTVKHIFILILVIIVAKAVGGNMGEAMGRKQVNTTNNYLNEWTSETNKKYADMNKDAKISDGNITFEGKAYKLPTIGEHLCDKKIFGNFVSGKQKFDLFMEASGAVGFIRSLDHRVEWCKNHYDMNNLSKEIKKQFSSKQQKAEDIVKQACGNNVMSSYDDTFSSYSKTIVFDQLDKQLKSLKMSNLTKKDFCKILNDDATTLVKTYMEQYMRFYPNF